MSYEFFEEEDFLNSKLGKAFILLDLKDIRVMSNCEFTTSAAVYNITDEGEYKGGFVFFTGQDHYRFINENIGYLRFGSLGFNEEQLANLRVQINKVLNQVGIKNKWNEELEVIEIYLDYEYKDYLSFLQLVLIDQDDVTSEEILMLRQIGDLIQDDELKVYPSNSREDKKFLLRQMYLLFDSDYESFKTFFSGYYLNNSFHEESLEEGLTESSLREFMEELDWENIFEVSRRHCDQETISKRFFRLTGIIYEEAKIGFNPPTLKEVKSYWT